MCIKLKHIMSLDILVSRTKYERSFYIRMYILVCMYNYMIWLFLASVFYDSASGVHLIIFLNSEHSFFNSYLCMINLQSCSFL